MHAVSIAGASNNGRHTNGLCYAVSQATLASFTILTGIDEIQNGGFQVTLPLGNVPDANVSVSSHGRDVVILNPEHHRRSLQLDARDQSRSITDSETVKSRVGASHAGANRARRAGHDWARQVHVPGDLIKTHRTITAYLKERTEFILPKAYLATHNATQFMHGHLVSHEERVVFDLVRPSTGGLYGQRQKKVNC